VLDLSEEESQKWDEVANDALWEYYKGVMTEEQIAEVSRLLERE
jgi:hypothetical protein